MFILRKKLEMPSAADALPGRASPIPTAPAISSTATRSRVPIRTGCETAIFGLGCFWGAERKFWELGDGIHVTAVGYAGRPHAQPDL